MRHLIHMEWQLTYCGINPWTTVGTRLTSTQALVTCKDCESTRALVEDIHEATPDQFAEST